ncbi:MAG: hypothetical protein G01um101491_325 [Parcubacteria group bacterium Gr01-1014_91]|nr:MAG: hypothetical protein G01um101491_325 [Parcubacteria group bacterium Gr01-1014_91]
MKIDSNTILIIVATLVVAGGAYWYFFTDTGNEPPLTMAVAGNQAQTQFQTLVTELQPISFDTKIFSDKRFTSLVDLATPIAAETAGRSDPFASIPGVTEK